MNKFIFLDCDGVINFDKWYISEDYQNGNYLDPDACPEVVQRINRLCDETGAKIVISSTWKVDPYYKQRLEYAGLKNVFDKTPDFIFIGGDDYSRGWEIQDWIDTHDVDNYIIIDDVQDFYESQLDHFLHISPYRGFTEDDFLVARNMLNSNYGNK